MSFDTYVIILGGKMKRCYMVSRIVICVLAGVVSFIVLNNEHITLKIGATVSITVVAFVMSFLATPISKQMINIGDGIMNKYFRIFYYIILLPLILLGVWILWMLIHFFYAYMEHSAEFGKALGEALITIFLCGVTFIMFIVPYLQMLIVLLLRVILKDNNTSN